MTRKNQTIISAVALAQAGVDYSPKTGAVCPCCGAKRLPVVTTRPWDGDTRTRYHRCDAAGCVLAHIGQSIKSVEVDPAALVQQAG